MTNLLGANTYELDAGDAVWFGELAVEASRRTAVDPSLMLDLLSSVPPGLAAALNEFAENPPMSGFLRVTGLEIGDLPMTPNDPQRKAPVIHPTTGALALVAESLGRLVGYFEEKGGSLIHDVVPIQGEETKIENSGSVQFDFHTENVHHPLRPDFLALLCLRTDHDRVAATSVSSIRQAVDRLDPKHVHALRPPVFQSFYPESFRRDRASADARSAPHPVLFGAERRVFFRYDSHNTHVTDETGTQALEALAAALQETRHDLLLEPGDLVIIDNHIAAHGRSAFTPRWDGNDRWLRRCYALRSIPHWAEVMSDRPRVLPPLRAIEGVL
jgi:L-asparagine oxygenase